MPDTVIQPFLDRLRQRLPLHAEEGSLRQIRTESDLVSDICSIGASRAAAQAIVATMRRLYETVGLLDPSELQNERWAFVSFPASLLARSILETLASPGQAFFEPGYWIQGNHRPDEIIEEQRRLLHRVERQRLSSSALAEPNPIRTVHVAWGLIKLNGAFLLRAREDRKRPDVKGHVFPGGRLDPTDLPVPLRTPDALDDLFRIDSRVAGECLPETLARELREELDLLPGEYQASLLQTLSPFRMLEGTRNCRAYTQYNIAVHAILLTRDAELKVLDRAQQEGDNWAWFSVADLVAGKRADGRSAFIDAIASDLATDLARYLREDVPESSSGPPAFRLDCDSIELPSAPGAPIFKGLTGRETPLSFIPDRKEWELLMLLGHHARGLPVKVRGDALALLGAGWIRLDEPASRPLAIELAERLEAAGFPCLDIDTAGHCRLSVAPERVFFSATCFDYSWQDDGPRKRIHLRLKPVDLDQVGLPGRDLIVPLAPNFVRNLTATESGRETRGDFERESRDHFEPARALGLRKFVAATKKAYEIVVPMQQF
jgi:8-oxo-dGTP pyrophosphatase MutT (NUDIX family)